MPVFSKISKHSLINVRSFEFISGRHSASWHMGESSEEFLVECLEKLLWGYPELLKEFREKVIPAMIEDLEHEKDIRREARRRPDGTLQHEVDTPNMRSQNGDQVEKVASPSLLRMSSDSPNTLYARSGSPVLAQEDGHPEDPPYGMKTGCAESSSPSQTHPQLNLDDAEIAGEVAARSDTEKSLQMPEDRIDKGKRKATEEMGEYE